MAPVHDAAICWGIEIRNRGSSKPGYSDSYCGITT